MLHLEQDDSLYTKADLFLNNTVHGVLEGHQGDLWLSTNQGLIRFNPETRTGQTYNSGNGLEITEFSDGAFYKDVVSETLFLEVQMVLFPFRQMTVSPKSICRKSP